MNSKAYRALHEGAASLDRSGRGKIRVHGEDRARLLHAMCTNHIDQLAPGTGCYAFFLSAQGRVLADANVFCLTDYLLLDTEEATTGKLLEHLDKFIIADDVELRDFTASTATIGVEGPRAKELLLKAGFPATDLPGSIVECRPIDIAHTAAAGGAGYAIFVEQEDKQGIWDRLAEAGVIAGDAETFEVVRLENGQPRYGVDFTEANIPQEAGVDRALHFSKGCYLGQEIVERVRSRGHVNKRLTHLSIDATEALPKGAKILSGEQEAGEITSSAYSPDRGDVVAFGILRAEAIAKDTPLTAAGKRVQLIRAGVPVHP